MYLPDTLKLLKHICTYTNVQHYWYIYPIYLYTSTLAVDSRGIISFFIQISYIEKSLLHNERVTGTD